MSHKFWALSRAIGSDWIFREGSFAKKQITGTQCQNHSIDSELETSLISKYIIPTHLLLSLLSHPTVQN